MIVLHQRRGVNVTRPIPGFNGGARLTLQIPWIVDLPKMGGGTNYGGPWHAATDEDERQRLQGKFITTSQDSVTQLRGLPIRASSQSLPSISGHFSHNCLHFIDRILITKCTSCRSSSYASRELTRGLQFLTNVLVLIAVFNNMFLVFLSLNPPSVIMDSNKFLVASPWGP